MNPLPPFKAMLTRIAWVLAACGLVSVATAQPENDNFASAFEISGQWGVTNVDTTDATAEGGEPAHANNAAGASVWFTWIAEQSGPVTFDTFGSDFDTVMGVYTGTQVNNLSLVAANDYIYLRNGFWNPSVVTINAIAGQRYYIAVDGFLGGMGNATLAWAYQPAGVFRFAPFTVIQGIGPAYVVSETDGNGTGISPTTSPSSAGVRVTITRTGGGTGRASVDVSTADISAIGGVDYAPVNTTVTFDNLEMSKSFVIPIAENPDDCILPMSFADLLSFSVSLSNPIKDPLNSPTVSEPRLDPDNSTVSVLFWDYYVDLTGTSTNDPPCLTDPGVEGNIVNFERSTYRVYENVAGSNAVIYVNRMGDGDACEIHYSCISSPPISENLRNNGFPLQASSDYASPNPSTSPPPSPAPPDFQQVSGTLSWGLGDFNPKAISIPINNDDTPEFNEDFVVNLFSIPGHANDAVPGLVGTAYITIIYDDYPAGGIDPSYNVDNALPSEPPYNNNPGANAAVNALVMQGDDKAVIGGTFSSYNGIFRPRIARILTNGQLDESFDVGTGFANGLDEQPASVNALKLDGAGRILAGGLFNSYNGTSRNGIARINSNGTLDTAFNPGLGTTNSIWSVAVQPDGRILIAGDFLMFNNEPRYRVARLNSDGSLDQTFFTSTNGPNGTVYSVVVAPTGEILIGGAFTSVMGQNRRGVARLRADGTLDPLYDPGAGFNDTVYTMAQQSDGKLLVGGAFSVVDTFALNRLARLHPDGSVDQTFEVGVGADATVYNITLLPDGNFYIGGLFTSFNGTRRLGFARLLPNGNVDTSFMDSAYNQYAGLPTLLTNPDIEPVPFVLASGVQSDGLVVIGGNFPFVGGGRIAVDYFGSLIIQSNILEGQAATRFAIRPRQNLARLLNTPTVGPGNIGFTRNSYSVNENGGFTFLTLARNNGSLGMMGANFFLPERTEGVGVARNGDDYLYSNPGPIYNSAYNTMRMWSDGMIGTNNNTTDSLNYSAYNSAADDVIITLVNNAVEQPNRNAPLVLDVPSQMDIFWLGAENIPLGGALGKSSALLTIVDDDRRPGTITFATPEYVVSEGVGTALIAVSRTNGSSGVVSVNYTTTNLFLPPPTATVNVDYVPKSGVLTFRDGQTSTNISLTILNNSLVEPDETVNLRIFNAAGGATIGNSNAVLYIIDDDFQAGRVNYSAGVYATNEAAGSATITVNRTGGVAGAVWVDAIVGPGSNTVAGVDFTAATNRLVWNDGDSAPKTFNVELIDNDFVQLDKQVLLTFANPSTNGLVGNIHSNATLVILNDDLFGQVQFTTTNYYAKENGGPALITVVRVNGGAETATVNYNTSPISAIPGINYLPVSGSLVFGPGVLSQSFEVPITDNPTTDGNVSLALTLTGATPASSLGSPATALLTLVDEESYNEPAGSVDTGFDTTVGADGDVFALAVQQDGKIVVGGDFTSFDYVTRTRMARLNAVNGSLDLGFLPSGTGPNGTVRALVAQTDDRLLIGGTFTLVNGVVRNRISRLNADGSMDTSFNPGGGADGPVLALSETFLSGQRKVVLGGAFSVVNSVPRVGIARLNNDGSLDTTFAVGQGVNGTVFAVATYPTNSIFAGKTLIGGDFTQVNGTSRGRIARLNVDGSLDAFFDTSVGANDVVRAITIQPDGRVLLGGAFTDFSGVPMSRIARLDPDGTLDPTFNPGLGANDTVYSIALQADQRILLGGEFSQCSGVSRSRITRLMPDGSVDPQINFGLGANNLVAAVALQPSMEAGPRIIVAGAFTEFDGIQRGRVARLYGGTLSGMGAFTFSAPDYVATEGSTNATVSIRRLGGTSGPAPDGSVSVLLSTMNGTAISGVNYYGVTNPVVFPLGETLVNVNLGLIDDSEVNPSRNFEVLLSDPQPADGPIVGGQPFATVTIVNDDSAISFSSPIYTRAENAADGVATITINRVGDASSMVTVEFATTGNGSAVPGINYLPLTELVTFLPGEISKNVKINLINNTFVEGDRTVTMELRDAVGALLFSPSDAVLTIVDDDRAPGRLAFSSPTYSVSEAGTNAVITVIRTNGWTGIVSVNFSTAPGTAIPIGDYQNVNVNLVFADGETNKTVLVPVFDNTSVSGARTVLLTLANPTGGATLGNPSTATLTILDNDVAVAFASPVFVVNEDGGNATLSVLRLNGTNGITTVRYSTTNGTATAGVDYSPATGVLTFNPGETIKTLNLPIVDDPLIEGDENFYVGLFNPSPGVQLATPTFATVVILDNDTGFSFTEPVLEVLENSVNAVITVVRTNPFTGTASVAYSTQDETALAGADYQAVTGTLVFTNGESVKTIMVPIVDDQLAEGDESFTVSLSNPSPGSNLLDPSVQTVIIVDNDAGFRFSSATYAVTEDGLKAVITVLRTNYLESTVSVNYATENGTAMAGSDYVAASGTLTFANGETSKSFDVFVIDDTLIEGDESLLLSLSNPSVNSALLSPSAAVLTILDQDGSDIKPAGVSLISESRVPANGVLETNETVTLWFALRNALGASTTNLTATLLATNGVTAPSAQQNYGVLTSGGPSASRQFTFTAVGTNGGPVTATFELRDNALPLGLAVFNFTLGTTTTTFSNSAPVAIRDNTTGDPYPALINVSGVGGSISQATISVSNITHSYSGDIDALLVSPAGANVVFFSDAGGVPLNNVSFTFSDTAANTIPATGPISSGTYQPYNAGPDFFPAPAPAAPYGTNLAVFNGSNPNGLWSLYVADDSAGDLGTINGGWYLRLTTANPVVPSADLAVALTAAPNPVIVLSNLTYTITVTNFGPGGATNTVLTNVLPAGATFLSAATATGSAATNAAGALIWTVGTLAKDARATLTVVMRPNVVGALTNSISGVSTTQDLNPGNNTASVVTTVNAATADLALGMDDSPDPAFPGQTVLFSIMVTNFGPATATSVRVTNVLPAAYQYLPSSTVSQGTISANGQTVIASLGNLGANAVATIALRTRAVDAGTYTNAASSGSLDVDPFKGNNLVSVKSVIEPNLLTTTAVGNTLVISYPNVAGYILQTAASLTPPVVWSPVNTAGAPVVNGYKQVTIPMTGAGNFYRVVAP
jgi:uncharacterized delta-60 repeat protein/uncharacterized repeat protein (TIGR01451 family)